MTTDYTYDPDRYDCEILLDRGGWGQFTMETIAEVLGVSRQTIHGRLRRGFYPRPEIMDGSFGGWVDGGDGGGTTARKHEWSREQVIDMMLQGQPKRVPVRKPLVHGTEAGYHAHGRRKIPMCDACRTASTNASRSRKYRDKAAA